jgi:hypothetical protein
VVYLTTFSATQTTYSKKTIFFFWIVTPIGIRPEDGDSICLQNAGPHGVTTQKNNIVIFTALRTSNLTNDRLT